MVIVASKWPWISVQLHQCARNAIGPWNLLRAMHDTGYDINIRNDGINAVDITASRQLLI